MPASLRSHTWRSIKALLAALALNSCVTASSNQMREMYILAPSDSVDVNGVRVNFTTSVRNPEDVVLVLLHGFGASLESWHDVYPALSAHFSVVRLDLKGHGFSSKPEQDNYSLEEQAHLVAGFIRKLGLKRVVLVGHSFGGGVALITYLNHLDNKQPFDVVGLILINSAGYPQELPFFVSSIRNPVTRYLSYLTSPEFRARFVLERIFVVTSRVTPDRIHRYAFFLDLPGSRNALKRTAENIIPPDADLLVSRLKEISVPTLVVWGQDDAVIPIENAHRFGRDLKNSVLRTLPQTGHVPHEERPDLVVQEIDRFVRTIR